MSKNLDTIDIVDIIEATVRVLVGTGLTRNQSLQVMLSQIAVQVDPKVMETAMMVNKKYFDAFTDADWNENTEINNNKNCGSKNHPFAQL